MPRRATELTPAQIRQLRHPGGDKPILIAVGGIAGLTIKIHPSGTKSWLLRGRFGEWQERTDSAGSKIRERKKREIGLGAYPEVLPGAARDKARDLRQQFSNGIDPIAERRTRLVALAASARRKRTFMEAFEEYSMTKKAEFSSERYFSQWSSVAERYAFPSIGNVPVSDISLQDVLSVLKPIWDTKNPTATKLRQIIEGTLSYATVHGYREGDNPARWQGNLAVVLAAPSKVSQETNYPAIQLCDIPRWWRDLQAPAGMGAAALRFQALTVTRTGAIRYATWDEFDLENGLWTIQPGRTASKIYKRDGSKKVVLTEHGVSILRSLPRRSGSPYVFWAPRGGNLSDATIGKVMRSLHEADIARGGAGYVDGVTRLPAVPHGLRSSFRTWVSDLTTFDTDMAEIALFHKVGTKVQRAYDRSEMLEKRRAMMCAWENFILGG